MGENGIDTPGNGNESFSADEVNVIERAGRAILHIFHHHLANGANLACRNHRAGLHDHRVINVRVGDREHHATGGLGLGHGGAILKAQRNRLVADHVNTRLHEGHGDIAVGVVGRADGHRIDAILAARLYLGHLPEVGVNPFGRHQPITARGHGNLGIRRQRACHDVPAARQPRAACVPLTHQRAAPAADHAQPQPPARGRIGGA